MTYYVMHYYLYSVSYTPAYKCSWQFKPFLLFCCGLGGAQPLKRLTFEGEYCGAEDWAELQGHISESLIKSTVARCLK